MKSATNHQANIYVNFFSGATVDDKDSYVLPSKKFNNVFVVLHCGTNDLKKRKEPKSIADDIVTLALSMNSDNTNVAISLLITRRDDLDTKRVAVNKCFKLLMLYI